MVEQIHGQIDFKEGVFAVVVRQRLVLLLQAVTVRLSVRH